MVPLFLNKIVFFCHANLSFSQNKVGIVVNRVQQPNLGLGFLHGRAFGQSASLLPLGLFHGIAVFSGNFSNHVGHYINRGRTYGSPYDSSLKGGIIREPAVPLKPLVFRRLHILRGYSRCRINYRRRHFPIIRIRRAIVQIIMNRDFKQTLGYLVAIFIYFGCIQNGA